MPELVSKAELISALGKLVRSLSALFWGLPLTLIVYVQTARTDWMDGLEKLAMIPAIIVTGLLYYSLSLMRHFQKQERVWIRSVERAQFLTFINLGLCPFLYWWHRRPGVPLYDISIVFLGFSSILFLFHLNQVLQRLALMLPDETLRLETKLFTSFNRSLLIAIPILLTVFFTLSRINTLPPLVIQLLNFVQPFGVGLLLFLVLMPLAMTMALIWKIKEVIFASVFDGQR